ncbi:hypothetical protein BXY66_3278 [Shimia isoporae]|uniref:Uncharacterized protein n=1 Tax=Shimia isoporae TaxID=647720 RepID=A0A4R1N2L5_9RHOB|nr:hypothetical protein [Shimia isoporae]TCL00631.1 hypothetical protein BXY66_3278 [Shimia isoporae]
MTLIAVIAMHALAGATFGAVGRIFGRDTLAFISLLAVIGLVALSASGV